MPQVTPIFTTHMKYLNKKQLSVLGNTKNYFELMRICVYNIKASSKRPNEFSWIGRKPNEILQFKWKRLAVLKFGYL